MKQIKLMQGDNILSLKKLPENSIDSIVTDPPYGLSFMNKKWDYEVPSVEFWKEVLRVLKPGGHVLSFGGTRTYHRMVVNMEDAGFEIRDQIMWIYGSGFPKSLNIGKAFDKKKGNEREVVEINKRGMSSNAMKPDKGWNANSMGPEIEITKGSSQYEGWGTALKPANEPICLARKPLSEKTIVDNVIKWGTGGINVDGCRIDTNGEKLQKLHNEGNKNVFDNSRKEPVSIGKKIEFIDAGEGRFPANILFDEEAANVLDEQSGISKSSKAAPIRKEHKGISYRTDRKNNGEEEGYADKGGASRFFYVAKVGKKERNLGLDGFEEVKISENNITDFTGEYWGERGKDGESGKTNPYMGPTSGVRQNTHPTLKPINLMTYLCRLITPQGGIILDPFMGSGSTGISACLEGFRFVGMELQEDYFKIAEARINNFEEYRKLLK
jgi:site-specific DNA-methyltransferase (adenine-specific)